MHLIKNYYVYTFTILHLQEYLLLAGEPLICRELSNHEPASGALHSQLVTWGGRLYNSSMRSLDPRGSQRIADLARAYVCVVLARLVRQHPRGQEDVFKNRSMSSKIELATLAAQWFDVGKLGFTYESMGQVNRYGCGEEEKVQLLLRAEDKLLSRCADPEDCYNQIEWDKAKRALHRAVLKTGDPEKYFKNENLTEAAWTLINRETAEREELPVITVDDQELTEVAAGPFQFILKYLQTKTEEEEQDLIQKDGLGLLFMGLRGGRLRLTDQLHTIKGSVPLRRDINLFLIYAGFAIIRPRGHFKKDIPNSFPALAGILMQDKGCAGLHYYMKGHHCNPHADMPGPNELTKQDGSGSGPLRDNFNNSRGRGRGRSGHPGKRFRNRSPSPGSETKRRKY